MALDQQDFELFKKIRDALIRIGDELHTLNESHSQKRENNSLNT